MQRMPCPHRKKTICCRASPVYNCLMEVVSCYVKVKVEDDKTLLAMLEADKQLVYNTKTKRVTEKRVDAGIKSDWRSHHLIFRNSSFESIVQEISSIYEVTILFENEALKQRQITASLDDRDAIETILDILCVGVASPILRSLDS